MKKVKIVFLFLGVAILSNACVSAIQLERGCLNDIGTLRCAKKVATLPMTIPIDLILVPTVLAVTDSTKLEKDETTNSTSLGESFHVSCDLKEHDNPRLLIKEKSGQTTFPLGYGDSLYIEKILNSEIISCITGGGGKYSVNCITGDCLKPKKFEI